MTNDEIDQRIEAWQEGDSNDEEIDGLTAIIRDLQEERAGMFFLVDRRGYDTPDLIGPFATNEAAEAYATAYHPDDIDGTVWVLQAVSPVGDMA